MYMSYHTGLMDNWKTSHVYEAVNQISTMIDNLFVSKGFTLDKYRIKDLKPNFRCTF